MKLEGIPMPPSVNKIYATNFKTGRRFKSKDALQFEADFSMWVIANGYKLGVIKNHLTSFDKSKLKIELNVKYFFPHDRLYTKQHKPRKFDVCNLGKMLYDQLSKAIEIDDCYFFKITEEKLVGDESFVSIDLTVVE